MNTVFSMLNKLIALALFSLLLVPAANADLIALTGATVHPVSSDPIEGTVLLRDGLVEAVGTDVAIPDE